MSTFSLCWLCIPTTTKVFRKPCLMSQEKTKIFRSGFHHFYRESSQVHRHEIIKERANEKHGMLRTYSSSKDRDLSDRTSKLDEYKHLLHGIYEFSRPHTLYGVIISIISVSLLPITSWAQVTPYFLVELLKAMVPFLFLHVYTVGINQIYDVEIDKVNKPSLPLASGRYSMNFGIGIVVISLIMGLGLGIRFGSPASLSVVLSLPLLGSLYSIELPYMRWKSNPFLAAFCIVSQRSVIIQLAYFIHMQKYVLGEPVVFSRAIIFAVPFMFLFASVVAIFKDIPDVDGDKLHDIKTFSVYFGRQRVFWLCIGILMTAYGGAMAIGIYSSSLINKIVAVLGHFSLAFIVLNKALRIDITNNKAIKAFYMFIWKLFYAEYFLILFMR